MVLISVEEGMGDERVMGGMFLGKVMGKDLFV